MKSKKEKKGKEKNNKIKLPKTKKQKLKIKHLSLVAIAFLLVGVFIALIFINKDKESLKTDKNNNNNNEEVIENKYQLTVYDENSNLRPYAVMIPNDSQAKKRHYGLSKAYIIYEITVEGGITRLLALFKDVNVEKIGPVRSSRHYYLDYAMENDAIYVHFGWSPLAQSDISKYNINNLNGLYNPSNMFWRDNNYSSPNNAYTSTDKIKKAAEDKKYNLTSDSYKLFNYVENVDLLNDSSYKDAKQIKIYYTNSTYAKYTYDEENKYYLRFNNEDKHIDNETNSQLHFKNILVLKINNHTIPGDEKGRQDLENIGAGDGYYITNGGAISIKWEKDSRTNKTILKDLSGNIIDLNDGNTFIQIQPVNKNLVIE